jgi:hypothetical protein
MMMNVGFPTVRFNSLLREGKAGEIMKAILDELKPEAVYFTEMHGARGVVLIVNLPDPSKVPALAEPWFLEFDATVEFRVVMSGEELGKGDLEGLEKRWG